jgi:predicted DNA-binding transcriptional regulator AlpA
MHNKELANSYHKCTDAKAEESIRTRAHDRFVPDSAAAEWMGTTQATMRRWRHEGRGPRYVKLGSNVRYKIAWLEEFLDQQTVETRASAQSGKEIA